MIRIIYFHFESAPLALADAKTSTIALLNAADCLEKVFLKLKTLVCAEQGDDGNVLFSKAHVEITRSALLTETGKLRNIYVP